jgi:DNA-binding phage protein
VRLAGNPELATVLKVISALGLQLHVSVTDKAKLAV